MATHPMWWADEEGPDGGFGGQRAALAPLPPSGRLPFAAMARHPVVGAPHDPASAMERPGVESAGFATFPLASLPDSPCVARSLTRTTLQGWGLPELTED